MNSKECLYFERSNAIAAFAFDGAVLLELYHHTSMLLHHKSAVGHCFSVGYLVFTHFMDV